MGGRGAAPSHRTPHRPAAHLDAQIIFGTPYTGDLVAPTRTRASPRPPRSSRAQAFLDSVDCDYTVHGDDISMGADGVDCSHEAKLAGRFKVFKRTEGCSTTDVVGRLLLMTRAHHHEVPLEPGQTASALAALDAPAAPGEPPASPTRRGSAVAAAQPKASTFLATSRRLREFSSGRVASPSDRTVYIDGAFDMLHVGHVQALAAARNAGDFLLVGIYDDATVNGLRGENYPILSLHERALSVLALGCVDEVILGVPYAITSDLLTSMNVSVVVCPPDLCEAPVAEDRFAVPRAAGILQPTTAPRCSISQDDVVQRIVANRARYEKRNAKRGKKETDYLTKTKTYVEEL